MHISLVMYVLAIIHCQELRFATGVHINKYNNHQQQQLEQRRDLEQQLINIPVPIFHRESLPDSLPSPASSTTTSGISSPSVDRRRRRQEEETTPQNTIIDNSNDNKYTENSKGKPLGRFLRKLWQQRFNPFFHQQSKNDGSEEPADVMENNFKRYSLFVSQNKNGNNNNNRKRGWIPERDNSKHSSVKEKGKGGIGVWGRRREAMLLRPRGSRILNEEGEIKKDILLMLINGLEK